MLATLQKTLQFSLFIGDDKQQRAFFVDIHRISTLVYVFALCCWSVAVVLIPSKSNLDGIACVLNFCGMIAGVILTHSSRTLKMTLTSGAATILFISFGFRAIIGGSHDPAFWVLPLGLLITLTSAPLFNGLLNYLCLFCTVWTILGTGYFPVHQGFDDQYWPALALAANLVIGITLNVSFLNLRIKNYLANAVLSTLAYTDPLTGLNNRRKFTQSAQALHLEDCSGRYFFLMLDIDDFKKINDTFGHDKGDEVLQRIAAIIAHCAANHVCGRLGGEEFGIIYCGDATSVRGFAMQLLRAVSHADVAVTGVSVSIGITNFDHASTIEDCYRHADESLYCAKKNGKNQFHFAAELASA